MAFEEGNWVLQQARSDDWGQGPFSGWVNACAAGQRAARVDGLLTVLGNCTPLTWSKTKAPGNLEDGGTVCQTFKNLKQKNLSGISLQVRSRETRELEAEADQPCSLCAETASAVPVSSRCLPAAQCRGHQVTRETSSPAAPAACHSMAQTLKADGTPCFPKH